MVGDPNPHALGENLRYLRQARKLSQAALAERAGLSRVGYRSIETGASTPRADTLAKLAASLGVGLGDLVRPTKKLSSVRFRAKKKMATREAILADVGRWLEAYAFIEDLVDEQQDRPLRNLAGEFRRSRSSLPALEAARAARTALGLGPTDTIRDICGLLEDHGVKVFAPEVASDQFFGLSVGEEDGGPAVAVNTWDRITVERWIFTAAHELGHLILHQNAYDVEQSDEADDEEKEADLFASEFLVPDEVFWSEWEDARGLSFLDAVFKLKSIFRVSWKTVVYRLANKDDEPGRVWKKFHAEFRMRYKRKLSGAEEPKGLRPKDFYSPSPALRLREEPEHLNASLFREDRLSRLVRRALDEELITLSRAAEVLDLSAREMRQLAGSWLE